MNFSMQTPTLRELQGVRWTKKGIYQGNPQFRDTLRLDVPNQEDRQIEVSINGNVLLYEDGAWTDATNPENVPTTVHPAIAENICLKKRVETLIRTAAISEIEVRQLKQEIQEARTILSQLANL
jgi:hypothetical protein